MNTSAPYSCFFFNKLPSRDFEKWCRSYYPECNMKTFVSVIIIQFITHHKTFIKNVTCFMMIKIWLIKLLLTKDYRSSVPNYFKIHYILKTTPIVKVLMSYPFWHVIISNLKDSTVWNYYHAWPMRDFLGELVWYYKSPDVIILRENKHGIKIMCFY